MENKKNIILGILGLAIIATTAYLTQHYFIVKYPEPGISGGTFCNINQFFNCDVTTNSPFSNIAGIPISIFGMLFGLFLLLGAFLKNTAMHTTNKTLSYFNFFGCLLLFFYSLIALGGLCPMCTVYYILSGISAFIYWKYFTTAKINIENLCDFKIIGLYTVLTIIAVVVINTKIDDKEKILNNLAAFKKSVIDDYYSYDNLGKPEIDSEYRLMSASENFSQAPIRITLFSDFQCPACKALEKVLPLIIKKYQGQANIQFFFYPLDIACNSQMQRSIGHDAACKSAYLAACLPKKFHTIHDDLFAKQDQITPSWVAEYAKKEGVSDCYNDPKTKEKVVRYIAAANAFNIKSTPSMLINGVKVEGVLPFKQLSIILDELIKRAAH